MRTGPSTAFTPDTKGTTPTMGHHYQKTDMGPVDPSLPPYEIKFWIDECGDPACDKAAHWQSEESTNGIVFARRAALVAGLLANLLAEYAQLAMDQGVSVPTDFALFYTALVNIALPKLRHAADGQETAPVGEPS